jgi:hypothetical protein
MPPTKPAAHVVIDKSTTARINVAILCSIIGCACGGAWWSSGISHSITDISQTLKEVKVEIAKNGGTVNHHAIEIIRLQEKCRDHEKRITALEKAK